MQRWQDGESQRTGVCSSSPLFKELDSSFNVPEQLSILPVHLRKFVPFGPNPLQAIQIGYAELEFLLFRHTPRLSPYGLINLLHPLLRTPPERLQAEGVPVFSKGASPGRRLRPLGVRIGDEQHLVARLEEGEEGS